MRAREGMVGELGPLTVTEMKQYVIRRENKYEIEINNKNKEIEEYILNINNIRQELSETRGKLQLILNEKEIEIRKHVQLSYQLEKLQLEVDEKQNMRSVYEQKVGELKRENELNIHKQNQLEEEIKCKYILYFYLIIFII